MESLKDKIESYNAKCKLLGIQPLIVRAVDGEIEVSSPSTNIKRQ